MIKFHGSGKSGRAAADYLEAEKDHAKRERANVEVLRGDPQLVAQVADSLDFKNRHTSGVIAWALEDNPDAGGYRQDPGQLRSLCLVRTGK